jgi:hypothetical protein
MISVTLDRMPKQFQRRSVEDCFTAFIWQGVTSNTGVEPSQAGRSSSWTSTSWKTTSVEDLLRMYNWAGRDRPAAMAITPDMATAPNALELSLRLPVAHFFDCFTWAGKPNIAPLPTPSSIANTTEARALNLDNFSKLF